MIPGASFEITSSMLPPPRKVWLQHAQTPDPSDCVIFLDAEIYIENVKAFDILRDLQTSGRLASATCIYLSHLDAAARHFDFTCNETYSRFLATELLRAIEQNVGCHKRYFLCGLSLSGLAAIFTALRHPKVFSGVLSQSPSAWWNGEWLSNSLAGIEPGPARLWISVGDGETEEDITHAPSGLYQKASQLHSVRRLARELETYRCFKRIQLAEFHGGHDTACWAAELPDALEWLMRPR